MDQLLAFLNSCYPMSEELQEHLKGTTHFKCVKKNDYLLSAGRVHKEICFIQRGLLRCFYRKKSKEVNCWFMKEGDLIVSIESFYDQVESYEYIQALEDCELYYITYNELNEIYNRFMEFNFIGRVLTVEYLKRWARQLRNIRMMRGIERYEYMVENDPDLLYRVCNISTAHMASYLGMNKTTLYNTIEAFRSSKKGEERGQ